MRKILYLITIINCILLSAQTDTIKQIKPKLYPNWTLWIPGATHFYDHRIAEGILFLSTTIGGITLGYIYDNKLKTNSSTPYYNFPSLLGMQSYNIDKCDWMRNRLEAMKFYNPDFKYDPLSFNDLLKAPFQTKNIFTPITGSFVAIALAELFLGRKSDQNFRDIDQIYFVDHYMNKNHALAIYGATSLAASYGAGIGEEYAVRNTLMPFMDYKLGQKKGLIFSSLIFGSLHFFNVLSSNNPDYAATLIQVGEATIGGYFLGRDVQKRDYDIGPAIAAHMWYDFTLMLGSFLIDPKNNFLGVNMKFKI